MPQFTEHAPGSPCWVDLMSPDVDASKDFYVAVFGWDATDSFDDDGNRIYTNFSLGGDAVAGLGGQAPGTEGMPAVWNTYVRTDDLAATVAAVPDAGGTVVMPPMPVMEAGHMAIVADPAGAVISLWQPGTHPGAGVCNEPGTWAWNELVTRDIDGALPFYSSVFGWEYDAMDMGPMGTYHVIRGGENGGWGGLMPMPPDMPAQVPNHWMVYFLVLDTDATIARVETRGGSVASPPTDSPVGTITIFHDPHGGSFATLQPRTGGD